MKRFIALKKFFSEKLNYRIGRLVQKAPDRDRSIKKLEKELKNRNYLLHEKKTRFRQARQEYKICSREIENLEDMLWVTEKKRKARRIMGEINPLINRRTQIRRDMEILKWEIRNLKDRVDRRRKQYEKIKIESAVWRPNSFLPQPGPTGF